MKILNTKQIKDWDSYTIANEPIMSIDLMERAAQRLFYWINDNYKCEESFVLIAGSGNNGGDALALARIMYSAGFLNLKVVVLEISSTLSSDCRINLTRLQAIQKVPIDVCEEGSAFPTIDADDIIIDGIFGSGLTRPVTGYWQQFIEYVNENSKQTIAIDIPSGLFGEANFDNKGGIIRAQFTLTFQFPKLAFLFADNLPFFGKWVVLEIGLHSNFVELETTQYFLTEKENIASLIKQRSTFDHKGSYGHAFLIAGSYQKTGAAVLAAKACMRSGVGLLTVHVPASGRQIMQTAVPEAMVCIDETEMNFCQTQLLENYSAIGIGPGIGNKNSMQNALKRIIENNKKPIVLDADALNILAENKEWLNLLPENSILTPHPGEFDRLTHKHASSFERFQSQLKFSKEYHVIIVLKGAYTCISNPEGLCFFNSNGNPGMATAGSGDVLTGIILSLLAQGYKSIEASKIGVFLHGFAGDLAADKVGYEALIASDIINSLGDTFKKIKKD